MRISTCIAYFGLAMVLIASLGLLIINIHDLTQPRAPTNNIEAGSSVPVVLAVVFSLIGAILALVGGLNSRIRFAWISMITVGCIYVFSFFPSFILVYFIVKQPNRIHDYPMGWLIFLFPGLACIVGGALAHIFERNPESPI